QKLAMRMNQRREERGSIDFDLPEPVIEFDENGQMRGVTKAERTWANRLIEEFMLAANECVATWLEDLGVPSLYRVHAKPDPRRVVQFEELAASFGYTLGLGTLPVKRIQTKGDRREAQRSGRKARTHEVPEDIAVTPKMYQKLVSKITGKAEERVLSYLMLRSLKQARYSEVNEGHFALAAPTYTHFTSPIRRYPDLIVHRILKDVLRDDQAGVAQTLLSVPDGKHHRHEIDQAQRATHTRVAQPPSAVLKEKARDEDQVEEDKPASHARVDAPSSPHMKTSSHEQYAHHFSFTFSTPEHSPWSKRKPGSDHKSKAQPSSVSPCLRGEKSVRGEKEILSLETLHDIADSSSQAERAADEAERELMEWKKLKFMESRLGEDFDGLIVNVMKYGFFVELTELFIEGLVPIDTLEDDHFTYRENTRQIIGQHSGKIFSIGDRVRALADRIDHVQRKIQFALVSDESQKKPSRAQKRHKKSHR